MLLGQALKQRRDEKYTNPGSVCCSGSSSKHPLSWQPAGRMHQGMHWEMHQVSASPGVPGDHSRTSIGAVEDHPPAVLPPDQAHRPGWSTAGCFISLWNAEDISSRYAWWLVLLCHWIGIEETRADVSKTELEEGVSSSLPWEAILSVSCENRNFQSYCSKPWQFHPRYNFFPFPTPPRARQRNIIYAAHCEADFSVDINQHDSTNAMDSGQLTPIQGSALLLRILDFSRLPWPRMRKVPAKYKLPVYRTSHPSKQTHITGPRASETQLKQLNEKRHLPLCARGCNSSESFA